MKYSVTVIVPIYNTEKFLNCCLESLSAQTHNNIDFLLIDDGSTDSSADICKKYALTDARFRYFYKSNGGVSSARNYGISLASGQLIGFVDADDTIHPDMFLNMSEQMEMVDLVMCGYVINKAVTEETFSCVSDVKLLNLESSFQHVISDPNVQGFVWNKLFRADILKENTLIFDSNIHICEDLLFCIDYLSKCKNVKFIPTPFYSYKITDNGAMSKSFNSNHLTVLKAFEKIFKIDKLPPFTLHLLRNRLTIILLSLLRKNLKVNRKKKSDSQLLIKEIKLNSSGFIFSQDVALKYKLAMLVFLINYRLIRFV